MNKVINAETLKTTDEFNEKFSSVMGDVRFSDWIWIGKVDWQPLKEKRLFTHLSNFPNKKNGNYIIAAQIGDSTVFLYTGIAVGTKKHCIRNRISHHISYSQNDRRGTESGLLKAWEKLPPDTQYYASYFQCDDRVRCNQIETNILQNFDFACNIDKKKLRVLRIEDIVSLYDVDKESVSEPFVEPVLEPLLNPIVEPVLEPATKKRKVIKVVNTNSNVTIVCGCGLKYSEPKNIKHHECPCGAKRDFA